MRTPRPVAFDLTVVRAIQVRTSWLICHEALSQTLHLPQVKCQHPDFDALARQDLATPLQKIQCDRTDRPTVHKAQQHALGRRWTSRTLDQHPVAG